MGALGLGLKAGKKLLPGVIGGVAGGAVKGSITAAATIAGSTIEAVGSTLGGALQGMLTQPDQTTVNVTYSGINGSGTNNSSPLRHPDPKTGKKPTVSTVNSSMSVEQLLGIAVEYLSSIDTTIKGQQLAAYQASRIKIAEDREKKIETPMGVGAEEKNEDIERLEGDKKSPSGSMLKALAVGIIGAGGIAAALKAMDTDGEQSTFSKIFDAFITGMEWLFTASLGLDLLKGIAARTSAAGVIEVITGALGSPLSWIVAAPVAMAMGLKHTYDEAWDQSKQDLNYLDKNYGIKGDGHGNYTIKGKKYSYDQLEGPYKDLVDAYGPAGSDGRNKASRDARARMVKDPDKYNKLKVDGADTNDATKITTSSNKDGYPKDIYDFFVSKGWSSEQARGIAAGVWAETGTKGHTASNSSGGGQGAYGLGQWRGSRLNELRSRYGNSPTRQQQLEFLNDELRGKTAEKGGKHVEAQTTAEGTLSAYVHKFMRPGAEGAAGDMKRGRAALGKGPNDTTSPEESSIPEAVKDAAETVSDLFMKGVQLAGKAFRAIGATDSTYKPLTVSSSNFDKYKDLYQQSLIAETNSIAGPRKQTPVSVTINQRDEILRNINGGSLDVINPNYNLSEGNIITSYITFFGFGK